MRIDSWLKLSPDDGINFELLKTRMIAPNPEYASRVRMGFKTVEFHVTNQCRTCERILDRRYINRKDIPKICEWCHNPINPIVHESEMTRFHELFKEIGNELWIPRGLITRYEKDRDIEDCTTLGDREVDFKSKIQLGPNQFSSADQKTFVETFTEALRNGYGAIGQAHPGYGKTIMALEVIARLKRPAAVLVHKEFFTSQWTQRITDSYNIPQSDVGYVQRDVCDYEDKKIVLIMIQSLLAREYPKEMFNYFGTVCVDEVHRIAAQEFRKTIVKFPARYRLGITATPKRADNLERVFFWHIGDIAVIGEKQELKAKANIVSSGAEPTYRELQNMYDYRGKLNLNKITNFLIEHDGRNRKIAKLIKKALKSGRKILVLSGRINHLRTLHDVVEVEMKKDGTRYTSGYYIGGLDERQRTISATRQLIFGTFQMAEEGLDIPELDTLFLVTPRADIEQAVGRILRSFADKKTPMVVDFSDPIDMCNNMLRKRISFYRKRGYLQ